MRKRTIPKLPSLSPESLISEVKPKETMEHGTTTPELNMALIALEWTEERAYTPSQSLGSQPQHVCRSEWVQALDCRPTARKLVQNTRTIFVVAIQVWIVWFTQKLSDFSQKWVNSYWKKYSKSKKNPSFAPHVLTLTISFSYIGYINKVLRA